jgi:hypothetical protein
MKRPEKINGGYQPSSLHHGEGTPVPPKGGTGKTEPKHTFPTWEEFKKWSPFVHQDTKVIYDYFRNRIQADPNQSLIERLRGMLDAPEILVEDKDVIKQAIKALEATK